jgi:3'-5' exoribonuclease
MFVRELSDGQELEKVLLVRGCELRAKRDGTEFLRLSLADRTGAVAAIVTERARELEPVCEPGVCVAVDGRFELHPRYGPQIALRSLRAAEPDEYDLTELLDGPPRPAEHMEAALRDLIAQVQSAHLQELLDRVVGPDAPTWPAFRDAPAAKRYHQAYRHGLLEHSLSVAQAVSAISATFGGIDRDVAVTGALLHDVGKLDAYTADPLAIDLTDAGKLQG